MMYLKLAWRNMWRSRRRTLITVASIFFAVFFAVIMRATIVGIFDKMIDDTVSMSSGYIQIHHVGYWANKSVDSSFEENPKLTDILNHEAGVTAWTPRLESFSLASSGERTKGIFVSGIQPEQENAVTHLSAKVISGDFLSDSDNSIMLAEGLAQYLKLKVNDTVVLLGQGYHGNIAAGKYPVKAIIHLPTPEQNKAMAWLPMARCQEFLSTGARYTSVSLLLRDRSELPSIQQNIINETAGNNYEVMTWQEMIPELQQFFDAKMNQNVIMSGVLYLVIAFGIFGTILMMLNERMHEFGILIAIGMKKRILATVVVLELMMMSVIGIIAGVAGAFPLVVYFKLNPIHMSGDFAKAYQNINFDPVILLSDKPSVFIIQGYVVLGIAFMLSLYPLWKISRLNAIQAINS